MIGAILFYNRPVYLQKTIKSLESNTLQPFWYFLQDGPPDKNTEKCKEVIQRSLLKGEYHQSEINISPLGQYWRVLELAEKEQPMIIFEDDMVVSPYYIQLIEKMLQQFPNSVVTAADYPNKPEPNDANLKEVFTANTNFWGYGVNGSTLKRIRPHIEYYTSFLMEKVKTNSMSKALKNRSPAEKEIRKLFGFHATGIDGAFHWAMQKEGIKNVTAIVPRGRYIGERGLNQNPTLFRKQNFHNTQEFVFHTDPDIESFIPHNNCKSDSSIIGF